jgi:hypothetical protein
MAFLEPLQHLFHALFVGLLMVSSGILTFATPTIHIQNAYKADSRATSTAAVASKGTAPSRLHSAYETGGPIPKILIENSIYQEAAAGASQERANLSTTSAVKNVLDALVNIYCHYKTNDNNVRITAGTGFFIDQNGVILTNAHVAQFLLFEETGDVNDAQCVIRKGDPARPLYEAKLLYISPAWINENASLVETSKPKGTGERDYALLYVSKGLNNKPLPEHFPYIAPDPALLSRHVEHTQVLAGGYPAEKLLKEGIHAELSPVIATTTVENLYTFGSNYADIFSISASPVGEEGSSGGPIVNNDHKAIGLITTKGDAGLEGATSLRALTLSYIDRTIKEETGYSLEENMQGDLAYRGSVFKKALASFLSSLLVNNMH